MELPNEGNFGIAPFVLCKEVVFFGKNKMYKNYREELFWSLKLCPLNCREVYHTVSLYGGIRYQKFHCKSKLIILLSAEYTIDTLYFDEYTKASFYVNPCSWYS